MPDLVTQASWMSDALLGWFLETTVVASALAALAAVAVRVRRITPGPAARHAVWLMVMVKLVTPPLVHWPWSVPSPLGQPRQDVSRPSIETARADDPGRALEAIEDSADGRRPASLVIASADDPDAGTMPAVESWAQADAEVPGFLPGIDLAWPTFPRGLGTGLAIAWLVGSITIGVGQARRVIRFRRLLDEATPAPAWLVEDAERVGLHLGVGVPEILVVPRLGTPLLWCLGRPVLLVPEGLLKSLEAERWSAIVAHELAHLRRGDHWVRRLELVAGLVWWWNPLYWLARRRLDFEAELACDAWALWASVDGRLSYAESLIRICTTLSSTKSPAPALGVAGSGRSFERRLTMILHDRVDRNVSASSLMASALLAALALPSWTMAGVYQAEDPQAPVITTATQSIQIVAHVPVVETQVVPLVVEIEAIEPIPPIELKFEDDDDEEATAQEEKAKAAKLKAERAAVRAKKEAVAKEMAEKFGPDSEFAKKMEAMGQEMEKKFGPGSEFAKKMEAMGKEMEEKFGPGSEFAKEIEKKFGPDSKFAKEIEAKFGPDSEFAKKMKEIGGDDGDDAPEIEAKKAKLKEEARAKARAEAEKARADAAKVRAEAAKVRTEARSVKLKAEVAAKAEARAKAAPSSEKRAKQIEDLESRIEEMMQELKKLKAETDRGAGARP